MLALHTKQSLVNAVDAQQWPPMHEALSQPAFEVQEPPGSLFAAAVAAAAAAAIHPGDAASSHPVLHCRDIGQTEMKSV